MTLLHEKSDLLEEKNEGEIEESYHDHNQVLSSSQPLAKPSKTNEKKGEAQKELVVPILGPNGSCSKCTKSSQTTETTISTLETKDEDVYTTTTLTTTPSYYRPLSALFYALSSLLYVLANKIVLTNYQ